VAKQKTALEAAEARNQRSEAVGLWWMLGILLTALALALAVQAVQVVRQASVNAGLRDDVARVATALRNEIARFQDKASAAASDPMLGALLDPWPGQAPTAALERLRVGVPDALRAEIYGPELTELLGVDLARFGYSRASALAGARSAGGVAPAYVERTPDGRQLVGTAHAIRHENRIVGWSHVVFETGVIGPLLDGSGGAGRIELRQGGDRPSVLAFAGRAGEEAPQLLSEPVAQSLINVIARAPRSTQVGDYLVLVKGWSPSILAAVGLVLLLLAAGAFWRGLGARRAAVAARIPAGLRGAAGRMGRKSSEPEVVMPDSKPASPSSQKPGAAAAGAKPVATSSGSAVGGGSGRAVERSIFRAYDIRGVVGQSLTEDVARLIGQAVGSEIRDRGLSECVVGRDGRLSGPRLTAALIEGLKSTGCDVIDIGAVPTPVLYFATYHLNAGSGVMVTGSHNPPDYNGFKIVVGGQTLADAAIQDLYSRIANGRFTEGRGTLRAQDVAAAYIDRISGDIQVERPLRVVVDAGNGIAGAIGPQVLEAIGCEVFPLHCEVDGNFPNHHPDPSDPHNLEDLIVTVKRMKADLGLAFDGDGDRLGVVTAAGEIIYPDRLLMLFAIDVLTRNPGATIIYDVKCTGHLQDVVLRHGGSPLMWKTGHSLIKAKMREQGAELAGEMSGHFFFRERWFGFDDGIYSAARLAEIVAADERDPQELFDELPKGVSTPELKVEMTEGAHYAFIEKLREKARFPDARISTIDGIRADYTDGWGLVRASNTTPILVLRFDADSEDALIRIQNAFREQILAVDSSLRLPF
jgi:phosphomannomutase/phosphoglucomutase